MTNEELDSLRMTQEELSAYVNKLQKKLEADTLTFTPEVMTEERIKSFCRIRSRKSDGMVELASIDIDTAMFIRTTIRAFDVAMTSERESKEMAEGIDQRTPSDQVN